MTTDRFLLECGAVSGRPRVLGLVGEERLCRSFDFRVTFALEGDDALGVKPADVVGTSAVLALGDEVSAARVAGKVAELELLEVSQSAGGVARAVYGLRLVPDLWFLRHSKHSRVFVDKKIPEIIEEVLGGAGVGQYELRLQATYAKRAHVCQYHESDLEFIERWVEREGITYFFDHQDGSKLVFVDAPSAHASLRSKPVPYHPRGAGDVSPGEMFSSLVRVGAARAKDVTTSDYNYATPDAAIEETADIAPEQPQQLVQWLENEPDGGGAKAASKVAAERDVCERKRFRAVGRAHAVHAGFTFEVDRHPVGELNRAYLAVRVIHRGRGPEDSHLPAEDRRILGEETYWAEIEAIADDQPFRPPRETPWPRAAGLELGRVDGEADSDYAQLDDQGRYFVRLMMDEAETGAGKASTRIRQLQPHGGSVEGHHFPLRKGTEVLVAFLGGDPDRPVIAAAMPHAQDPSPVVKNNHTQNVLQTGGLSRFELEDKDGSQYVDVSTPPEDTFFHIGAHAGLGDHNVVFSTSGDGLIHTGGNRDITIDADQNEDVTGDLTETYKANQKTHVAGAFTETIDAGSTETIHAGLEQTITGGLTQDITGGEIRKVSGGEDETVNGSRTQTINGSSNETVTATQTQKVGGAVTITTPATYKVDAKGGITINTDGAMNVLANSFTINAPGGHGNVDFKFAEFMGMECLFFATRQNVNGTVAQALAIGIAGTGHRDDAFGNKREFWIAEISAKGNENKTGLQWREGALAAVHFGMLLLL
jgi:type VI secretion system secreted protein VgrG